MDKEVRKKKLRRYLNGTHTRAEVESLQDILCDSDNFEILDELAAETWEEACLPKEEIEASHTEYTTEAEKLLKRIESRNHTVRRRFIYAAAGIAAFAIIAFFSIHSLWPVESTPPAIVEVQTSFGEKKHIILPDGSHVILNSCTCLQYPDEFSGKGREVQLTGEAYFEIAPDKEKVFTVNAGHFNVQVLGTKFDIKSYPDDRMTVVEVKSGKVQVNLPEAMVRLTKQEKIFFNSNSGEHEKKKNSNDVAKWTRGSLCFDHTPIRDVAHELERMFNCKIVFEEGQEFNNLISGEHDSLSLESVLESLYYVSHIKHKEENGRIILYK